MPAGITLPMSELYSIVTYAAEEQDTASEIGAIDLSFGMPHANEPLYNFFNRQYAGMTQTPYGSLVSVTPTVYCADTAQELTSYAAVEAAETAGTISQPDTYVDSFPSGKHYYVLLTVEPQKAAFSENYALTVNGSTVSALTDDSAETSRMYFLPLSLEAHSLSAEGYDATCTRNGAEAFWYCTECGIVFSDETGATPILDDYGNP